MKIEKLTPNQVSVLNKVWKAFPSDSQLESSTEKHISDFKNKYNIKITKTDIQKHIKKDLIVKRYSNSSIDDFFKKNKKISRASFNSIKTIEELNIYFLNQVLEDMKRNVKKVDSLTAKILDEDKIVNDKVMGILLSNYEKYSAQKTNTVTKKEALSAIDSIKGKVSSKLEAIINKIKDQSIANVRSIVYNKNYTYLYERDFDLKKSIKKILENFTTDNQKLELRFEVINSKYRHLSKENIVMLADYQVKFERESNNIQHFTKYKDMIKKFNEKKDLVYKFQDNDPYFLNMYNEHYVYLDSIMKKVDKEFNQTEDVLVNIDLGVTQDDYCNDYDTPNSTYLYLSKKKGSLLYVDRFEHNDSEIGKGYTLYLDLNLTFNYSLFSKIGRDLVKKYTKDSVAKMKKEKNSLIIKIQDQEKRLLDIKNYLKTPVI